VNWLAHSLIAAPDRERMAGSVAADFARGLDLGALPEGIARGVRQHRRVDAFTDGHPIVARARTRFEAPYRRYAGIVLDVAFDHFLARHFARFADGRDLGAFTSEVYAALAANESHLPPRLAALHSRIAREDWLASYRDLDRVGLALAGIGRRLSRPNPLATAIEPLRREYPELESDFLAFFPELQLAASSRSDW
jgi:acyl carrier protein phosphodiesterase